MVRSKCNWEAEGRLQNFSTVRLTTLTMVGCFIYLPAAPRRHIRSRHGRHPDPQITCLKFFNSSSLIIKQINLNCSTRWAPQVLVSFQSSCRVPLTDGISADGLSAYVSADSLGLLCSDGR
jgi:hypothetical protein